LLKNSQNLFTILFSLHWTLLTLHMVSKYLYILMTVRIKHNSFQQYHKKLLLTQQENIICLNSEKFSNVYRYNYNNKFHKCICEIDRLHLLKRKRICKNKANVFSFRLLLNVVSKQLRKVISDVT